jgi:hypothetical protein
MKAPSRSFCADSEGAKLPVLLLAIEWSLTLDLENTLINNKSVAPVPPHEIGRALKP